MTHHVHTITHEDIGKTFIRMPPCPHCGRATAPIMLRNAIGSVQAIDVGKRVYVSDDGVVQVENDEQRDARVKTQHKHGNPP